MHQEESVAVVSVPSARAMQATRARSEDGRWNEANPGADTMRYRLEDEGPRKNLELSV